MTHIPQDYIAFIINSMFLSSSIRRDWSHVKEWLHSSDTATHVAGSRILYHLQPATFVAVRHYAANPLQLIKVNITFPIKAKQHPVVNKLICFFVYQRLSLNAGSI